MAKLKVEGAEADRHGQVRAVGNCAVGAIIRLKFITNLSLSRSLPKLL